MNTAKYNFSAFDFASAPELENVSFLNSNRFLHSREWNENLHHLYLLNKNEKALVKCTFTITDGVAMSPFRATYGSIEITPETQASSVREFLNRSTEYLIQLGCNAIQVIQPPECYSKDQNIVSESLLDHGFELMYRDCDQYLEINSLFDDIITPGELGKLKKCKRQGFQGKCEGIENLEESHHLIEQNLKRKGLPISMTFHQLREMFEIHPSHYLVFNVRDANTIVSTIVSIRITDEILYNFYHADHEAYQSHSPTVMAVAQVYEYARHNGFHILDLGVSSEKGEINQGLFRFKKALGAHSCERLSWKLDLN